MWWDHTPNLQAANQRIFELFAEETGGVPVDYTYHQTAKLGQALQLAKQSGQLPDVHSLAGLMLPVPVLIDEGWLRPLQLDAEARRRLPDGALVEGIHIFDGEVYSVPIFNDRQYWAATWFNKEMLAATDAAPPATYDEFRTAARAVQDTTGDETYGWIFNLGMPPRVAEHVNYLAQAAGFEGFGGQLYRTGEIAYHHDAYVTVIEFLLSLRKDGLLFPGSQTLDDKTGRVRWAAGAAGFYIDGPWCPGTLKVDAAEFLDKLDVAPILRPDASTPVATYRGRQGGMYWISKSSGLPAEASQLIGHQTERQYYVDIAKGMAQPPLDLSVIDETELHPAWRKLVNWYAEQVFLAPVPVVGNPEIELANAETKPVQPDLGTIVQGMFSGDVTDVRGALKQLSDRTTRERERSVAAARRKGANVELDDWAFPNWRPRQDFTAEMYR